MDTFSRKTVHLNLLRVNRNYFGCHVRLIHRLAHKHGLAHDVANDEDVRHIGAHLDVDINEATVCDRYNDLFGADLLAFGPSLSRLAGLVKTVIYNLAHSLQGQVFFTNPARKHARAVLWMVDSFWRRVIWMLTRLAWAGRASKTGPTSASR